MRYTYVYPSYIQQPCSIRTINGHSDSSTLHGSTVHTMHIVIAIGTSPCPHTYILCCSSCFFVESVHCICTQIGISDCAVSSCFWENLFRTLFTRLCFKTLLNPNGFSLHHLYSSSTRCADTDSLLQTVGPISS